MDALGKRDWTVMVYQGGSNNLDSSLQTNLQELAQAPFSSHVDVVVRQIDRQGQMRDFHRDAQGMTPLGEAVADVDSADPNTLGQFLRMAMGRYPARHYLVVLSSHGRGAEGLMEDERKGSLLSPPELAQALESARQSNQGIPLDAIFFDACRMMTVEVASEIQASARVAIGSMDRIGSAGYDPQILLQLVGNSEDGSHLARQMVKEDSSRQHDAFGSLAAIQLNQLEPLHIAFQEFTRRLLELDREAASRVRELATLARRSLPSPTYLEGLDNMAHSILLQPQTSQEELQDWLEQMRPADPVAILPLCHDLLGDELLMQNHPKLEAAVHNLALAHQQAILAQRGDALSVVMPIETHALPPTSQLNFDRLTGWPRAVRHIIPSDTPAILPPSWLEQELPPPQAG
jgi:hypothetical protein